MKIYFKKLRILSKQFEFFNSILKGYIGRMIAPTTEYGSNVAHSTVKYEENGRTFHVFDSWPEMTIYITL